MSAINGVLDFTDRPRLFNYYQGANRKFPIDLDGKRYMLKLTEPLDPSPKHASMASKANTPVSEYLGCHVFELAGIPVQETVLGTFNGEPAVACRDFILELPGGDSGVYRLAEFAGLVTEMYGSSRAAKVPDLGTILGTLEEYHGFGLLREAARERFWQTFAVDALIGNFDRHCGNWGYIVDAARGRIEALAPVYDCGSSLYSRISPGGMMERLADERAFRRRVREQPRPALRLGGAGLASFEEILASPFATEAREALAWVRDAVSMADVEAMVESAPGLTELQVDFYKTALRLRMEEVVERGAGSGGGPSVQRAQSPELAGSIRAAVSAAAPRGAAGASGSAGL